MNLMSSLVGLSIMGAAAPSMMTMSLAPFEAQKRAQNLGIAESAAVTYAAKHEGASQLSADPDGCVVDRTNAPAIEITCTEGEDTKYVQSVSRSFRLAVEPSCDDNDGNNGHGNSGGNDCSNPGNGGYAGNDRVFAFPSPPGFTGHQCLATDNWGLDTSAFDREKNKWKGRSCTPGDIWSVTFYNNSNPNDWMYDVNGHNGWGSHADY